MKKIIYYTLIALAIGSAGCKKLLNEDVRTQISNVYINTPSGLEDGVRGCYATLRFWYGSQTGGWMTIFGTDEYMDGNADVTFPNYTANLNPANGAISGIWAALYKGINDCNTVIDAAPKITMDETKKAQRVAEARALRAHYYFLLVQQFGPIQLSLTPTATATRVATRSPLADVYRVIVDDLTYAIATLPPTTPDYGRVTKYIAENMLAKVYLTRAGSSAAVSTDYDNAANMAKDVINKGGFKLLDNFSDLFSQPMKPNTETLWACQFSNNPVSEPTIAPNANTTISAWNAANFDFCAGYEGFPGMVRDLANGRPFAHYRPTSYMLGLYNKAVDTRFNQTFKTVYICNKPGTYTINGKSVTLKRGDTSTVILDHEATAAERNAVRYLLVAPSEFGPGVWPMNQKFQDSLRAGVNDSRGVKDVIIYRLAETYLIAAEALIMSGHPADAVPFVNTVRTRAAIKGATPAITAANVAAMQVTTADMSLDFILDERARELSGEFMRWEDLVRTGKLLERVKKYNPVASVLIKPYHVLRPIPQTQIDRTEGNASAFPQNQGYN